MKLPNGFFGNGPGAGDDSMNQRDIEAINRSRLQFTVATSTFAGIAIVGLFCSCLWFVCCRHSSKTRKKGRTWATANPEAGLQTPYSYEGYLDSQGCMQMHQDGVAPYMNNPTTIYGENGLSNEYDFNEHFGFNQGGKAAMFGNAALHCGTSETMNLKDVPPSYTALFFAASDSTAGSTEPLGRSTDPKVTSIQPIHLKVTSSQTPKQFQPKANDEEDNGKFEDFEDYADKRDLADAPPVSLMSVEFEPENTSSGEKSNDDNGQAEPSDCKIRSKDKLENPPAYNPGYNGYMKF